jgi:hypothetical protein
VSRVAVLQSCSVAVGEKISQSLIHIFLYLSNKIKREIKEYMCTAEHTCAVGQIKGQLQHCNTAHRESRVADFFSNCNTVTRLIGRAMSRVADFFANCNTATRLIMRAMSRVAVFFSNCNTATRLRDLGGLKTSEA